MENLTLHHIGVATKNIEKEFKFFEKLGYKKISDTYCDHIHKIKEVFITAPNQPPLELLENLTPDGPLTSFLKKRIKFYHYAYTTKNIEKDLETFIKELGAVVIVPVSDAVYFEKICFVLLPNQLIVELVQEKSRL